ncbi:unnamed protein product [Lampetra planeri]
MSDLPLDAVHLGLQHNGSLEGHRAARRGTRCYSPSNSEKEQQQQHRHIRGGDLQHLQLPDSSAIAPFPRRHNAAPGHAHFSSQATLTTPGLNRPTAPTLQSSHGRQHCGRDRDSRVGLHGQKWLAKTAPPSTAAPEATNPTADTTRTHRSVSAGSSFDSVQFAGTKFNTATRAPDLGTNQCPLPAEHRRHIHVRAGSNPDGSGARIDGGYGSGSFNDDVGYNGDDSVDDDDFVNDIDEDIDRLIHPIPCCFTTTTPDPVTTLRLGGEAQTPRGLIWASHRRTSPTFPGRPHGKCPFAPRTEVENGLLVHSSAIRIESMTSSLGHRVQRRATSV